MTQKEKQLLLIDLCARLPYEPMVEYSINCGKFDAVLKPSHITEFIKDLIIIKPYLRPMSSMTEEELRIYKGMNDALDENYEVHIDNAYSAFDWLNKNGFDYRGLIPMGLALEAMEGMYKTA